jgi:hypothetical protein
VSFNTDTCVKELRTRGQRAQASGRWHAMTGMKEWAFAKADISSIIQIPTRKLNDLAKARPASNI